MDANSIYGRRAIKAGLDPKTTSIFALCCVENGLNPNASSFLDLAAVKMGKQPGTISLHEAEKCFGDDWVSSVCK